DDIVNQPGRALDRAVLVIDRRIHVTAISVVEKMSGLPVVLPLPRRDDEIAQWARARPDPARRVWTGDRRLHARCVALERKRHKPSEIPFEAAGAEARIQIVDRKSTRLNSSHVAISYAVFCLKKK